MVLFNSLSAKKELFSPLTPKSVSLYVCGITPYDTTHLGHAFTYIFFDVLQRYLRYKGYNVIYTQNVTDINDRDNDILKRAKEQNTTWERLAEYWTKKFLDDMQKLNWIKPTNYFFASEHLPAMIDIIKHLLKNGLAYQTEQGVYLDVTKVKDYGILSRLTREEMISRAKEFEEDIDNPYKRDQLDVTLWRSSEPNQPHHIPSFDSPFGKGRPGWHIECSAMAFYSLGEQIDIHGGGEDLKFPHHESEIAQTEGATGKIPFAKYWLHTGTVLYKGEKMSKSLGNLVLVSDLLKKYSPNALRWLLLSNHYRKPWEFKEENLQIAEESVTKVQKELNRDEKNSKEIEKLLDDDVNTPKALRLITENPEGSKKILTEVFGLQL